MEEQDKAEEAAGARITKKKTKGKQGRQAKLTSGATDTGNSLKETRPSSFAEVVPPIIPEYSTEKKVAGRGRGKVKSEPKSAAGEESGAGKDDPKQKKLTFESSGKTKEETKSKKADSKPKKEPAEKPSQSRKRKVKEVVDSFIVSFESELEEEEEEVPKKSLRERVELRKTKTTDYKDVFSGDDSVESEASWRSGGEDVEIEASPPMKKAKLAAGGSRTADATGEGVKNQAKLDSGKNTEPKVETKSNKPALEGAEPKGPGKRKREAKTATAKPVAKTTAKQTAKQAAKPSTKTVGGGKSTGSSSSGSSGEKKKGKVAVGKKRVVSHDFVSDDELDCNIESGSESDSFVVPAKKVATEVCVCVRVRVCVCVYVYVCVHPAFMHACVLMPISKVRCVSSNIQCPLLLLCVCACLNVCGLLLLYTSVFECSSLIMLVL